MALVRCPDCSKEISDQAASCIHCGRPMASALSNSERKPGSGEPTHTSPRIEKGALITSAASSSGISAKAVVATVAVITILALMAWVAEWNRKRISTNEKLEKQEQAQQADETRIAKCKASRASLIEQLKALEAKSNYREMMALSGTCGDDGEIKAVMETARKRSAVISFGSNPELLQGKYPGTSCGPYTNQRVTRCFVPAGSSPSGTEESYLYYDNKLINMNGQTQ